MIPREKMGKLAYDVYSQARDGRAINGEQLPQWENLTVPIQHAWQEAAAIVIGEYCEACKWWHKAHEGVVK